MGLETTFALWWANATMLLVGFVLGLATALYVVARFVSVTQTQVHPKSGLILPEPENAIVQAPTIQEIQTGGKP